MSGGDAAVDLITIGRANMDLYSRDIGASFAEVPSGFDAMVGGSPTNIAIGTSRLGLQTVALTAVGDDEIGLYVKAFLAREGVITDYIPTKPEGKTAVAILGVMPPDRFPLVFYRDNAADLYIDRADVDALPLADATAVLLSGNAFAKGPCRDASLYAAERARALGLTRFLDLDLRTDQWSSTDAFSAMMRELLPTLDVVIGTEEEFHAALSSETSPVMRGEPLSASAKAEVDVLVSALAAEIEMVVLKRGPAGASLVDRYGTHDVSGFPVEVVNTVGAGDSFASGLIARRLAGDSWDDAVRYGNACGAICVSRHGCSLAMPTPSEVDAFLRDRP